MQINLGWFDHTSHPETFSMCHYNLSNLEDDMIIVLQTHTYTHTYTHTHTHTHTWYTYTYTYLYTYTYMIHIHMHILIHILIHIHIHDTHTWYTYTYIYTYTFHNLLLQVNIIAIWLSEIKWQLNILTSFESGIKWFTKWLSLTKELIFDSSLLFLNYIFLFFFVGNNHAGCV